MINRKKHIIFSIIISVLILIFFSIYFLFFYQYKGKTVINNFNSNDIFDISSIKTIEKEKGKDFTILNLADIQFSDIESIENKIIIGNEIKQLVEEIKPNLITLTGDQVWSNENLISIHYIINLLDSFKIPWAPVFGNHDLGNDLDSAVVSSNYMCQLYEDSKYCLFDRGPTNIGSLGNYAINIIEDEKIIETLYFIDAGYNDTITDGQKEWFAWISEGIKLENDNSYTKGIVFMHKPLYEYAIAFREGEIIGDYLYECSLHGLDDCDFFDLAKEKGVTNFICGHQHTNMMTLLYKDVYLTFALKTGEESFYYDDGITNYNGATYLTLNTGGVTINNYHINSDEYHLKNSRNIYN